MIRCGVEPVGKTNETVKTYGCQNKNNQKLSRNEDSLFQFTTQ